ncbi:MAG: hypothetical protein NUV35_09835, partial [Syntrophomonadaceae bacterium]|nr:hypothetical protein [Syntrophomonadaceae bacterium]
MSLAWERSEPLTTIEEDLQRRILDRSAVVGVVGLGYVGLVPGVAGLLGSDRPRDLGVRYTAADLASGNAKTGTKTTALPAGAAPQD